MDISTCEQYVLAVLHTTQQEKEELAYRVETLSKQLHNLLVFIDPKEEDGVINFKSVDAKEYIEKIKEINDTLVGKYPTVQEEAIQEDKQE